MRGWEILKYKTKEDLGIIPIGGTMRFLTNIEFRIPLSKSMGINIFYDGGILSSSYQKLIKSRLGWDIGLGLTLSTQITDKILINGEIGVPFGGVEETLIVGDVQIDFILNEDGSLKAKVFNKENEFRYIGDELGYTQGVGISYEVDFETFSELLSKILIRKND